MAGDAQKTLQQIHEEFTECTLCTEIYIQPKMLPCMHTFCLCCLNRYGQNRKTGETLPCPLCRREFAVPSGRFAALPNNIYISRLVELRQTPVVSSSGSFCKMCSERQNSGAACIPTAVSYCVECKKPLCQDCVNAHRNDATFTDHNITMLSTDKANPLYCNIHPKELISLYCSSCSVLVCVKCFCKDHNTHTCQDVEEVALNCTQQIDEELETLVARSKNFKHLSERQDVEISLLSSAACSIENSICSRADRLIQLITSQKSKLLSELEALKNSSLKQMHKTRELTAANAVAVSSLVQFANKVKLNGAPVDIINFLDQLKARIKELQAIPTKDMLHRVALHFNEAEHDQLVVDQCNNLIGRVVSEVQVVDPAELGELSQETPQSVPVPLKSTNSPRAASSTDSQGADGGNVKNNSLQCSRCGQSNHSLLSCRVSSTVTCYNCGQQGHVSKVCPGDANKECDRCGGVHKSDEDCSQSGSGTESDDGSHESSCQRCGRTNHSVDACRINPYIECYNCHQIGHTRLACPFVTDNEEEDDDNDNDNQSNSSEESSSDEYCTRCGGDHDVDDCSYPANIRCYKCHQVGHHVRICDQN